ncbi:MAG: glycosyltransferase [Deltaproteobacteria bacterium]|nr:glycosyltransferase [Deltaproteobacteria bacterium]
MYAGAMDPLRLSLIIPTLDRSDHLLPLLGDALAQAPEDAEIWVIDQSGDQDALRSQGWITGRADPRLRWVRAPRRGLPTARNVGLSHAVGEVVLFLDDDTRLREGCVRAHLDNYRDPRVGGVVGRIYERTLRPNISRTSNVLSLGGRVLTNLEGRERVRVATLKGANMSFRREALRSAGPFDPRYLGTAFLEDADMSTRVAALGWELWFDPAAALDHNSAPTGGVRTGQRRSTEVWRFHNTGVFVARHRGRRAAAATWLTFSLIAARRAAEWGEPRAAAELMGALWRGMRLGAGR